MIARQIGGVGYDHIANGEKVPELYGSVKKAWLSGAGAAADEIIEVPELTPLISQYLRNPERHQDVVRIDVEVQDAQGFGLGLQSCYKRVGSVGTLARLRCVHPEVLAIAPQIRTDEHREAQCEHQHRHSSLEPSPRQQRHGGEQHSPNERGDPNE